MCVVCLLIIVESNLKKLQFRAMPFKPLQLETVLKYTDTKTLREEPKRNNKIFVLQHNDSVMLLNFNQLVGN